MPQNPMIPPEGLQEMLEAIADRVDYGRFLHNGQEVQRPPFRVNIDGDRLRVLLYLDDRDVGRFENFAIISKSGKVLMQKPDTIEKTEPEGLMVALLVQLQEVKL